MWGVLAISGVVNDPTSGDSAAAQWADTPVLEGAAPSDVPGAKFVVTLEPIKAGKIGRAAIDGVVQVKLDVESESDAFASTSGSTSMLSTGQSGEAAILWKESGTGSNKWGLVRLGTNRGIVRGTFTAPWSKGSTKTVTDAVNTMVTYTAKNYFASMTGSGTKACAISYVAGEWILIAAEC